MTQKSGGDEVQERVAAAIKEAHGSNHEAGTDDSAAGRAFLDASTTS